MTRLHKMDGKTVAFSKGAPEIIVASCTRQLTAVGEVILDSAGREKILEVARQMAGDALRCWRE